MKSLAGTIVTLCLLGALSQITGAEFRTKSTQQQNDDAAKKVERKFRQYKRVHQEILKKIVAGQEEKALAELETILKVVPKDGESHYMKAVCHARLGMIELAVRDVKQALELGIEASRFRGGTKTGLEALRGLKEFEDLFKTSKSGILHGPMVGRNTGDSLSFWLRTVEGSEVKIRCWEETKPGVFKTGDGRSTEETDYTAVVTVEGLKPNTQYRYSVHLDTTPNHADVFEVSTLAEKGEAVKFQLAFGGGAGYVPQHEYMWNTIAATQPDVLMLLGDNVYSDAPEIPEMQHYCYYRRQSRPEFRKLVSKTTVYSIWDDHDFGTNDCQGGPRIDQPEWKIPVWNVYRNNWVNPAYGGGPGKPGVWYDYYIGDVHFIMTDGRIYRNLNPTDGSRATMLGPLQLEWLKKTIAESKGTFTVLVSPVPWVFGAKGDSKDTWNGFKVERNEIFDVIAEAKKDGVLLMSADRHRSDLWKIEHDNVYPLYEFNSSRLTNQHVHPELPAAEFSYNKKQSFGSVKFDTT
ncbi:MAG: alkaline phosphatase D family protein, partial [Planctomycetota bacterium]|nr:alkaline phosphatase D family protein [Planctomycetota bacterium]